MTAKTLPFPDSRTGKDTAALEFQNQSGVVQFVLGTLALAGGPVTSREYNRLLDLALVGHGESKEELIQRMKPHLDSGCYLEYSLPTAALEDIPWSIATHPRRSEIAMATAELTVGTNHWKREENLRAHVVMLRMSFFAHSVEGMCTAFNAFYECKEWSAVTQLVGGIGVQRMGECSTECLITLLNVMLRFNGAIPETLRYIESLTEFAAARAGVEDSAAFVTLGHMLEEIFAERAIATGDWDRVRANEQGDDETVSLLCVAIPWLTGEIDTVEFVRIRQGLVPAGAVRGGKIPKPKKPEWEGEEWGDVLYCIALLSLNTPTGDLEAARFTKQAAANAESIAYGYAAVANQVYMLAQRRLQRKCAVKRAGHMPDITSILLMLVQVVCVWDAEASGLPSTEIESELRKSFGQGQDWLVRQWYAVLHRVDAERAAKFSFEHPAFVPKVPHEVILVDLIEHKAEWENLFEKIERLQDVPAKAKQNTQKRIAWTVETRKQHIVIRPKLQSRKGRSYTPGRNIAIERLYKQDFPCEPSSLDLRVIGMIRPSQEHYESSFEIMPEALPLLAEHPAVFDFATMTPLRIEVTEPSVMLKSIDTGYVLQRTPDGDQSLSFEKHGNTIQVYSLTTAQQELFGLLGEAKFPKEGLARAKAILAQLSSQVLCSDENGLIGGGESRVADAQVITQLLPGKGLLKMNLLVRPLGVEGPTLVPGLGAELVMAQIADTRVSTKRDISAEEAGAAAILAQCPVLENYSDISDLGAHFEIDEIQDILALVQSVGTLDSPVEWPKGAPYRISTANSAKLRMSTSAVGRDWLDAEIELNLDAESKLEYAALLAALKNNHRFVAVSDGSFVELEESLRRRIERLHAFQIDEAHPERIHPLAVLALESDDSLQVDGDRNWHDYANEIKTAFNKAVRVPKGLTAVLRAYQQEGLSWAIRLSRIGAGACLADDMGLGKTVQTLGLLVSRAAMGPALVIAPASVIGNWVRETARFAPGLSVLRLHDVPSIDGQRKLPKCKNKQIVVTTYDLAYREIAVLKEVQWGTMVLDESQAIKNPDARRTRAIGTLNAGFKIALSGTPIENHLGELWSLFHIVNPGLLGSRKAFVRRFQTPIERDKDPVRLQQLQDLITPFMLRRRKSEVLKELPPRTEMVLEVELSPAERTLYEASRVDAVARLQASGDPSKKNHIQILAELTRLRQLCCHPKLVFPKSTGPSSKHLALMELVQELSNNGHRALIFSQFVSHLSLVSECLDRAGLEYLYLDGSTKTRDRETRVADFQEGDVPFFLISLKAGGVGLNLTAADYVIHMDPWWNPAVEDQASDRVHRIGQTRPVSVYRLIAKDTIEEKLIALHEEKRGLADQILCKSHTGSRLSADELLELLQT